jgi:hypothetical protein
MTARNCYADGAAKPRCLSCARGLEWLRRRCQPHLIAAPRPRRRRQFFCPHQRYNLLYELVVTGDDDVILPVLDRMETITEDSSEREALRHLAGYLRTHPATPSLVADGAGYESIISNGYYRDKRTGYTDGILSTVEARLSAGGLRRDSIVGTKFELRDQRGHMFARIIPSKLRGD